MRVVSGLMLGAFLSSSLVACDKKSDFDDSDQFLADKMIEMEYASGNSFPGHEASFDDGAGNEFFVSCTASGVDAFYKAGNTDDFAAEVVWRLDDQQAQQEYLDRMELDATDEDWWYFDDEAEGYEVAHPTAFLPSLIKSKFMDIEVRPSDGPALSGRVEITEAEGLLITECLEANTERVMNELRARGLID